jgi:dTDP-4-amino-4,6-dideoxygalactose transaminase
LGDVGCFSFYPGKNLGAFGEAGAIVTASEEIAARIRMLRDHGQARKYHHDAVGWNARMDGIQGAVLLTKLRHLEACNQARRRHAEHYRALLSETPGLTLPVERPGCEHVYHLFVVRAAGRDRLAGRLAERGVQCGIHYPIPVHLQRAYASLGWTRGSFPVSERCADEVLSLPMFPELTTAQIETVAGELRAGLADCLPRPTPFRGKRALDDRHPGAARRSQLGPPAVETSSPMHWR